MSIPKETWELQRAHNHLTSQLLETLGQPKRKMTRVERVLSHIALMWREPWASLASALYMRRRRRPR